ncbi:MAG: hypothetical protein ABJG88_02060 [Litorimonas sp.]
MQSPTHIQSQPQTPVGQSQWYIQVDQQNYGPFDDQTIWAFMCEGRINAQSLISRYPNTGYHLVSAEAGLMNWMAQVPQSQPAQPQNTTLQQTQAAQSVFMVMAEIRSGRAMDFLKTLQSLGDVERIGDSVWIIQACASSEEIRNILCQPLGNDDRLFIMDSFANETAWFNLGAQMDTRVRELWNVNR